MFRRSSTSSLLVAKYLVPDNQKQTDLPGVLLGRVNVISILVIIEGQLFDFLEDLSLNDLLNVCDFSTMVSCRRRYHVSRVHSRHIQQQVMVHRGSVEWPA
ncbi:hypothetical protein TNCV_3228961 [Trichonephila clavipes]|nr:hypothetical protein TNCV_3228961 [Trichonephila clavipes]